MVYKITIITLFPELFPGPLGVSIPGKFLGKKWQLELVNPRDFAEDAYKTVDDAPFGGGKGMVLKPEPLAAAIDSVGSYDKIIYPSPRGELFNQEKARLFTKINHLVIICGRYEAIDQRIIEYYNIDEVSIGDYVLFGGEVAAMAILESCLRLVPGIIEEEVHQEESFGNGKYTNLLEYPHYTRPAEWRGLNVPDILISGNHAKISKWKVEKSEEYTKKKRPDLFTKYKK